MKRVLVLVNPTSGLPGSFSSMRAAFDRNFEARGICVLYAITQSKEDGVIKARMAQELGCDAVLVVGGDGTVSTVGKALMDSPVAMGVIPTGSGNGFARHFGIPLNVGQAVAALADAQVREIDVGMVNGVPFFVTFSAAWDAAIVKSFDRSPVRGILPYVFSAVYEFLEYRPQDMQVVLDDDERLKLQRPVIFTVANLSQFGGGARIAPHADASDGKLELVVGQQQDMPIILTNLVRLFDGSIKRVPRLITRTFSSLSIEREKADPIQLDGELVEAERELLVTVKPRCLRTLVPVTD